MKLTYPACFYEDVETKEYVVVVPDLPGCTTGGKDLPEAIEMAVDAASGWVLTSLEDGEEIPKATDIEKVRTDKDPLGGGKAFVSMIVLDMDEYAEKYGSKAIRRNITLPAWLNTFAKKEHVNVSKVLQDALSDIYKKIACL